MSEIFEFDRTASNNNSTPPDGFPENMAYSAVNDSARELMAALARDVQARGAVETTGGGSPGIYRLQVDQTISAYAAGMRFCFKVHTNHTQNTAPQLNVNSNGAKDIIWPENATYTDYVGCMKQGDLIWVVYDGTQFQFINYNLTAETVKDRYEANSDTNAFTDALQTKLTNIQGIDELTDAQVRQHVADASDSNVYTDADKAIVDAFGTRYVALADVSRTFNALTFSDHAELDISGIIAGTYMFEGWILWERDGSDTDQTSNRLAMQFDIRSGTAEGYIALSHNININEADDAPNGLLGSVSGAPGGGTLGYNGTITTLYDLLNTNNAFFEQESPVGVGANHLDSPIMMRGHVTVTATARILLAFAKTQNPGTDAVRIRPGSWMTLRRLS